MVQDGYPAFMSTEQKDGKENKRSSFLLLRAPAPSTYIPQPSVAAKEVGNSLQLKFRFLLPKRRGEKILEDNEQSLLL